MHILFSFGAGLEELSRTLVLYHPAICDTTHANRQWQMLNKGSSLKTDQEKTNDAGQNFFFGISNLESIECKQAESLIAET